MRKIVFCLMATMLSLTLIPLQVNASTSEPTSSTSAPVPASPAEAAKVITLESRLKEIDAMDKTELKAADKKDLRKEVKSIKHELRTIGGGVYLSAGAVILILLLLIILL
jgi:hypothetical protein